MNGGETLDFEVRPNPAPVAAAERSALLANPGFGRIFTDHMVTVRYAEGKGWYDARGRGPRADPDGPGDRRAALRPGDLRGAQGVPRRPTAASPCSAPRPTPPASSSPPPAWPWPRLPEQLFLDVARRAHHASTASGSRPTPRAASTCARSCTPARSSSASSPSSEYLYLVIASPVGAYFKGGVKPVTVWVSRDYTRAAPGGTGAAKCGGNYAASLVAQAEAIEHGCDQVVFLDAVEQRYVDELGGMNIFFVFDDGSLVTPPLTGTILPGITRDSVLRLAADQGLTVREELHSLRAVAGRRPQRPAPRGLRLRHGRRDHPDRRGPRPLDGEFTIADGGAGKVTMDLRERLVGIQRGTAPDPHGWVHRVL